MKIVGYFSNHKRAKETVDKLKSEGFNNAYVDINDHFVDYMDVRTNLAGTSMGPSLAGLILESDEHAIGRKQAPLVAADPMVRGMGNFDEITDINRQVIVETDSRNVRKVKQIISSMGGELENPNIKIPRHTEDINIF